MLLVVLGEVNVAVVTVVQCDFVVVAVVCLLTQRLLSPSSAEYHKKYHSEP